MKHKSKVIIPGRAIDIYAKTDVAATFARIRREQAAAQAVQTNKVRELKRKVK